VTLGHSFSKCKNHQEKDRKIQCNKEMHAGTIRKINSIALIISIDVQRKTFVNFWNRRFLSSYSKRFSLRCVALHWHLWIEEEEKKEDRNRKRTSMWCYIVLGGKAWRKRLLGDLTKEKKNKEIKWRRKWWYGGKKEIDPRDLPALIH